jgi:EAL domain-containing protein (putative c-di-GMP-specific phosphodiesterase class I)
MYGAKEDGRNTFRFYTEEMTQVALERVHLEATLRHAIDRNQLFLVYQPQIDLRQNRMLGMEVLLRWRHPELGLVSPAKFIALAEESGVIHTLGRWVLYNACRQGKQWLDRGVAFKRIAVNVAGPQIQRGNLVDLVREVLVATGFPPERLELEVTEGFIMQQAETSIRQLRELREMGVLLSIDDFGTGYSSLSYLKCLPIDKLKIDQSFVSDIPSDSNDVAISGAIIALARSLGLRVVAEGVETAGQAEHLREMRCHEAQGYFFSKPLEAHALEALFGEYRMLPRH